MAQKWRDCHTNWITGIQAALVPQVAPRYAVDIEESVYLLGEDDDQLRVADVRVRQSAAPATPSWQSETATATLVPAIHTLPQAQRVRQRYLAVRDRVGQQVVTIIEVLSPTNKSDGRREYLHRRQEILANSINLIELDLLRGGTRLPTVEPLAPADYYAFVCRHERFPEAEVYSGRLREPLPNIPVPLANGDPDAALDLQSIFSQLYERAGYRWSLDYQAPVVPTLSDSDAEWVKFLPCKMRAPCAHLGSGISNFNRRREESCHQREWNSGGD